MFDAKPPQEATRPGGNALAFDWQLISDTSDKTRSWRVDSRQRMWRMRLPCLVRRRWMFRQVEDAFGVKSPETIRGSAAAKVPKFKWRLVGCCRGYVRPSHHVAILALV